MEKNKKQTIYRTIMLIVVVALITFMVTTVFMYNGSIKSIIQNGGVPTNNSTTKKLDILLATITELLDEKYIGEVNEDEMIDGALKGLVSSIGDVYTVYYTKEELEDFKAETIGNFVGIGVYLRGNLETGKVDIVAPMKGSPAEKAGIQAGDEVLKADGKEYVADELDKLSSYIKGEKGTNITLTIKRGEEIFDVTVMRDDVHINYVDGKVIEDNIGYISITTFDEGCAKDFQEQYNELADKGIKSLIIDLRSNGGGLVDDALDIADMMCDKNQTMLIRIDKDGKEEISKAKKDKEIDMPIVVLTNEATASASEILAGALKDNGKAEIVGKKTYGKGVIQELIYLANGGALKVTAAEYYTPNKSKINKVGIEPNHEVEYDYKTPEIDEQLNKAVEVIKEKMK
ncbi:MAG: S41 family peptidase [Clostridia bacterium]|nr:S41 family peptidase [Clostridia bacterium]MCI9275162.1 S41 family peptidase [Clostridia bacterium]